ncbi:MAG: response regulator transcription factor [Chitinophagales bacterium]
MPAARSRPSPRRSSPGRRPLSPGAPCSTGQPGCPSSGWPPSGTSPAPLQPGAPSPRSLPPRAPPGGAPPPPTGLCSVIPAPPPAAPGRRDPLTQRERDVLRLIVAGRTNRQIGEELYISPETVKSHVMHILRKLDVTSRTQAALRGRELGL